MSDPSSPLVAGPFGSVVGPLDLPAHHTFADPGPSGHAVLATTTGPLCATFEVGAGRTHAPSGGGFPCVQPPLTYLMPATPSQLGTLHHPLNLTSLPFAAEILPGSTWFFQCICRDFGGPLLSRFNASDALEITWTL